ncbi:MAG: AAA family ATPase [Eisenbergiella massiliensis]
MKKPLPIGVDDFKKLIASGYYYVDKTLFIKELLDKKGDVNLFTRPRRFGKTLNMSMLRYFFEKKDSQPELEENKKLFDGLGIMEAGERYRGEMGRYPVICLTLKSGKQRTYQSAYHKLRRELANEFDRHRKIKERLSPEKAVRYQKILEETASEDDFSGALQFLSEALWESTGQKSIILIDEYDVPLENAYFNGFYEEMSDFIRSLFESALKSNPYLEFGVITGCLRITKESIFTGLNNLKMVSILSNIYDEYFGFTQKETEALLDEYDRADKMEIMKEWYNGYRFGNAEVYNPWSVLNFLDALRENAGALPMPYWANTSSNDIVKSLVERADISVKGELEHLIDGGVIEKPVHEDITYDSIYGSDDNLWNFLFFTGYLKLVDRRLQAETEYILMAIPNIEVKHIFKGTIRNWFTEEIEKKDLGKFFTAIEQGNVRYMEEELSACLQETISFYDYAENYYHGFLTGLLKTQNKYRVISNQESGLGRPDIIMKSASIRGLAIIMELKVADDFSEMEAGCIQALNQIETRKYSMELEREGYKDIIKYGICFYKKRMYGPKNLILRFNLLKQQLVNGIICRSMNLKKDGIQKVSLSFIFTADTFRPDKTKASVLPA